jgi:RNA polymerase sigma-70 factor, ECF subfamily
VRAWIACIAVSQVRRRFRRRRLLEAIGLGRFAFSSPGAEEEASLESLASSGQSPEVMAELGKLDRALAQLPPDERIAWMLRHVEGESLEDVAAACGCSLATVKRRIAAADALVRRHVSLGEEAGS